MDSITDVSLRRKSTFELSSKGGNGVERKSSRVHAIASVRAVTKKLTGSSKASVTGFGVQRSLSNGKKGKSSESGSCNSRMSKTKSLTKLPSKTSLTKSVSKTSLAKMHSKTSLTKSTSKASFTKTLSKTSLTKSTSKSSLSKSASKASLTKLASNASLTKLASKASLTKSASKASLTKLASKASLTKSASKASLTKLASKASLAKSASKASLTKSPNLINTSSVQNKLTSNGGKQLWFPKGSHVAVRAEGSKFYLCRLERNVYNSTKEIKVRWLSVAGVRFYPNIYRMSYIDRIDPASILLQVELSQKSRLRYLLPSDQEEEIDKMINMVEDVQSGKISIQEIDDDIQEVVQIEEPPKKKPRLVKTLSQRVRDKALKTVSRKSTPKSPSKGKKTDGKQSKAKEPKRKLPKKEEDLKLNPRPNFKVLDKDPLFETREPMPYISKIGNCKLVYRAINLGDAVMLKKILKDGRRIKNLYTMSVSYALEPIHAFAKNPNKEVLAVLMEEFVEQKYKKRFENNQDDLTNLKRLGTGSYNEKSLAVSRIRKIQASRGSKEGNNAFLKRERLVSSMRWEDMVFQMGDHGLSPSTVTGLQNYLKKLMPDQEKTLELRGVSTSIIIQNLLTGRNKEAGQMMKRSFRGRHFAMESLMTNVLLFDTEDLPQCPPSAVKENCHQYDKITAMHCAATNPNSKYLAKLLSVVPNSQVPDGRGRRPIHFAAGCSSPDNLKLLLNWRVNTHDTCSDTRIPLHYAILARRADNVALLIDHDKKSSGTDPNVIQFGIGGVNRPLRNNMSPLHLAAEMEEVGIASILLSNGALVNAKTSVNNFQLSPLHIAAGTGNLEMVKLLVKHGAVVEQKDRLGRTALLMACMNGATKVLSYFLHIGANPERADSSDNTPLHYAAAYGWYFTVKMLMDIGVDSNVSNMWKVSPLFVAYMKGHVGIVRLLLGYGSVSINQVLNDGSTLLFHACESDLTHEDLYEQIEYMVKDKGALCDIKNADGETALFYLARASISDKDKLTQAQTQSTKIAQLLLDNGCDINAADENGFTAVMDALGNVVNTQLAKFLIRKGCPLLTPEAGKRTWTVLHAITESSLSEDTGLLDIIEILSQPKCLQIAKEWAQCYDEDGYTPLLHLCSQQLRSHLDFNYGNNKSENQKHFFAYFTFLVEKLSSDVEARVAKKYFSPNEVLPAEDSHEWYKDQNDAAQTPLMLILQRLSSCYIEGNIGTEKEHGAVRIARYLIQYPVDVNTVDKNGLTPLYQCVSNQLPGMMKYLNGRGTCDVDYEIRLKNKTFHPIVKYTSLEVLEGLLDIGCDPNVLSKGEQYSTCLHNLIKANSNVSTRNNILKIVEKLELMKSNGGKGYDFNTQDWKGRSLLHYLARLNPGTLDTSLELEYKVIQNGGKVGLKDKKGRTPLHYVFLPLSPRYSSKQGRNKDVDATQLTQMIAKSMSVEEINARDYNGKTALHYAAEMGASISCVTLLSQGIRKADISLYDKDGNTALTLAVLKGKDSCAVALIQSGANLTDDIIELSKGELAERKKMRKIAYKTGNNAATDEDKNKSAFWTLEVEKHLEQEVKVTRTPLYKAAMKKGLKGVAMLVSQADVDVSGCSPLDSIKMAFEECHYNIALEILYNQWHTGQLRKLEKDKRTLLHHLAISCRSDNNVENPLICKVANFLIQEKISIEQKDKFGLYPIHWAVMNRHFDLADLLAEHSTPYHVDPNGRHFSYLEAVLWKIHSKNSMNDKVWNYLEKLFEKGLDFNRYIKLPLYPDLLESYVSGKVKDPELSERESTTPTTALIATSWCSPFKFVSKLLKCEANPNLADGNKITPMMHAVMKNDKELVCVLLNHDYPNIPEDKPVKTSAKMKKKPNTSIFRLKPNHEDESESESDEDSSEEDEKEEKNSKELKPIKKTSCVDLDAKDKNGRTALHYVASPLPEGTFNNADLAFLLVKAGAKEFKDKWGMTPYALAVKTGAMDVAAMLKSLGHGKHDRCQPSFDRAFPVNDGVINNFSLRGKPDFRQDARLACEEDMEEDISYEHEIDESCTVQNGTLLKDEEQGIWYDVLLTKVDVKRRDHAAYNFYKIQLVHQADPSLYILFTCWGCIGMKGQFQHTPFSDLAAASKEFSKIFRQKTGNKWDAVKDFQVNPQKYRLLDDSARLAPPKMKAFKIDLSESKCVSALPAHLENVMNKMMNPKALVKAMERIKSLSMECLPFGRLRRGRLMQGKQLIWDIKALVEEKTKIKKLDEDEQKEKKPQLLEIRQRIVELSNEYFHVIPQKNFVYEDISPLYDHTSVTLHMQAVSNLLDYEVACQMLLGAMARQKEIHPAHYVYKCLDSKMELMDQSDPMTQLILKYIYTTASKDDKITGIYKISREGEAAKLDKTGLDNRRLLFHGTRASNLLSILNRGLITTFPEHGSCYGNGIYFSDRFSKSKCYSDNHGFVLLCEVALGKPHFWKQYQSCDDPEEVFKKDGSNSLISVNDENVLKNWFKLPTGVSLNLKPKGYCDIEYVLVNPDQVCIRYLVQLERNY